MACTASLAVSKMTVPEPLGRPSAPMLMSARMMLPAERKRSLRSCQPAWYGNCDGGEPEVPNDSKGEWYARYRRRAGCLGFDD